MKNSFYFLFLFNVACSLPAVSQVGRVGINTTTPSAMLHVNDSAVVFTGPGALSIGINPPVSGTGTRMMWFPERAAFRAGLVIGNNWDKDSIGIYSFATGYNTRASGVNSFAAGYETDAIGGNSTATGSFSKASGEWSTAMGFGSQALGDVSFASGYASIAEGDNSIAMGYRTKAQSYSTSIGVETKASGTGSTALGVYTVARAFGSTSVGMYNDSIATSTPDSPVSSDPLFIIGNGFSIANRSNAITVLKNARTGINTSSPQAMLHVNDSSVLFTGVAGELTLTPGTPPASGPGVRMMWYPDKAAFRVGRVFTNNWDMANIGEYSFASGYNTKASGHNSTAMGFQTTASGTYSTAIGVNALAAGFGSLALGYTNTYAFGDLSVALGAGSTTLAPGAIAIGLGNIASGMNSMALGLSTQSSGYGSLSMGEQTIASNGASTAMGSHTTASGVVSTSIGFYTTARSYASLSFGQYNDSIASSSTSTWIPLDPLLTIGNGTADNVRNNALTILKNAKTGINTSSPQAMLHVKESSVAGATYNPNSVAIFEGSGTGAFIQLSQPTNIQSGILSGNSVTSVRSALIFRADSSVHIRTGGNNTNFVIDKIGNVGVNTSSPSSLLDVNGSAKMNSLDVSGAANVNTLEVGTNGSTIAEIIKVTVSRDLPSIAVNTTFTETFPVTNAQLTSTVYISPASVLADGLLISYARVSVAGTVEVKFRNVSAGAIDPVVMNFYITVIR